MKKLLSTLFLLFFTIIFSQEYQFDNRCEFAEKQIKGIYANIPDRVISIFFYSKDSTYIAYNFRPNEIHLFDYKQSKLKLLQIKNDDKTISFNLLSEENFKKFRDEIFIKKVVVDDLGNDLYLIKTYSKLKAKKPNLELKIKFKKSYNQLVKIHFMDLTEHIHDLIYNELLAKLPNKNYQIESIYLDYNNGVIDEIKRTKCENINLKFDLNFSSKK